MCHGKRVLLIESHSWLRQSLRQLLLDGGCLAVDEATGVMEGVRMAVETQPALVIVDADLLEMSGSLLGQLIQMLVPETGVILLVDEPHEYSQLAEDKRVAACIDKRHVSRLLGPVLKRCLDER